MIHDACAVDLLGDIARVSPTPSHGTRPLTPFVGAVGILDSAGVNFNDGSAGGEVMEGNLIFNFVRETGDHVRPPQFA